MDMTPEQIREVVKMTLDELTQRKLLELHKINYSAMLQVVPCFTSAHLGHHVQR